MDFTLKLSFWEIQCCQVVSQICHHNIIIIKSPEIKEFVALDHSLYDLPYIENIHAEPRETYRHMVRRQKS